MQEKFGNQGDLPKCNILPQLTSPSASTIKSSTSSTQTQTYSESRLSTTTHSSKSMPLPRTEQQEFKKVLPKNEKNIFQKVDYQHKPKQVKEIQAPVVPQPKEEHKSVEQPPAPIQKPVSQSSKVESKHSQAPPTKPKTEAKRVIPSSKDQYTIYKAIML